ncbi:MAG: hypothetical protein WC615_11790 [Mucilaginibacter sp.]|jgi:hypothetical protein|uniref:hypothetical protein n=1 Tax=Mucilaginibacter sp. TaxID=1882438 RepID=UPI00356444F7
MFKPVLITTLLIVACVTVKAQYATYKPLPIPSGDNGNVPPSYRKDNTGAGVSDMQKMSGYVINANSQTIRKINLQVVTSNRSLLVVGLKELQDNYWTNFTVNKPIAEKLSYGEAFSDRFEYKVYIPTLGQTVYF